MLSFAIHVLPAERDHTPLSPLKPLVAPVLHVVSGGHFLAALGGQSVVVGRGRRLFAAIYHAVFIF